MEKKRRQKTQTILTQSRKNTTLLRNSFTLSLFMFGAFSLYMALTHISANSYAAPSSNYTCQPNGTFASGHTGAAALTTDDTLAAAKAMDWLKQQTKTRTIVTTNSNLQPTIEHPANYTGAIDGTFTLDGASYSVKNDAPLTITSPSTVADTYAGVIQGSVLTTPTAWRWIIQAYKKTTNGYEQVPKQALADATTGEFTIDLSDIVNPPVGEWAFGILDAENGYVPYGIQWPSPNYYDGLEVQQKLVTDGIYDWSTTIANADNTFHFDNSNTGKKLFRLVDTSSGDILAEHVQSTGLVRSYELSPGDPSYGTAFEDRSFVYDQAVALFAAIGAGDEELSTSLVEGLLQLQQTGAPHVGGFVFASPQLTPAYRDVLIRTGAHAIATDALLAYIGAYPSASNSALYESRAKAALVFLDETLSNSGATSGLYTGGYGDYSGVGNSFNPSTVITWASTEHNIDIWHAFTRAAKVLGVSEVDYSAKASNLETAINLKLYNATETRYNQGMTTSGEDIANPLDVNSWGAIQQYATGQTDKATDSLSALTPFIFTQAGVTGYAPFYDSFGYTGALPNVWFEGTFGVALAQLRVGDDTGYRITINNAKPAQHPDGSFDYVTTEDAAYELYPRKSVASTAWYVLATTSSDALWNYCSYLPPAVEPVITPNETPGSSAPKPTTSGGRSNNSAGSTSNEISNNELSINNPVPSNDSNETPVPTNRPSADTSSDAKNQPSGFPWAITIGALIVGFTALAAGLAVRKSKTS